MNVLVTQPNTLTAEDKAALPAGEPVAWHWYERCYNGTMHVAASDKWKAKIGFKVPQYEIKICGFAMLVR